LCLQIIATTNKRFNLEVDESKGLVTFYLPKGMMQLIHVSCYLPFQFQGKNTLDLMGWWPELKYVINNPPPEENENQRNQYEGGVSTFWNEQTAKSSWQVLRPSWPPPPSLNELSALIYNGGQYLFTPYQHFD
jgi:hypothetical protein